MTPICTSSALENGKEGVCFSVVDHGGSVPAFVVRHEGQVRAYLNRCAHVPVRMESQPNTFFDFSGQFLICALHGALYDPRTGRCVGGRCKGFGHLQAVAVLEQQGQVYWAESAPSAVSASPFVCPVGDEPFGAVSRQAQQDPSTGS